MCSVSGVVADANYLIDYGRLQSQRHMYAQHTPIYVEQLVQFLSNYKHTYTQFGSSRPFGVSLMYAGFDKVCGYQLYCSDPSGNYSAWKAHATGKNAVASVSTLKEDYKEGCSLKEALVLAMKVLGKSFDTAKPDPKRFEIGVVTRENGQTVQRILGAEEIGQLMEESKVFEEKKE